MFRQSGEELCVGTFGEKLQREREMRGITLEEIAEATKIGTRSLRALEEQDFDKLPGGIFNKGFVRAYSKYLGIDEEQAVADYVEAVNEAQATGKIARPDVEPPATEVEQADSDPVRIPWMPLIAVALLISVGFAARSYYSTHRLPKLFRRATPAEAAKPKPEPPALPESVPTAPVETGSSQPAAATTPASAAKPKSDSVAADHSAAPEEFVVKIHAKELAWVQIEADGKVVLSENLAANSDRVVQASKRVVIRTGNAGGIEVSQNNKTLPPLGPKNEVRTLTLTDQGLEDQ